MASEEKKFKIDELPDEGSSSVKPATPIKRKTKEESEPRLEKLKILDPVTKVDVMVQKWEFDEPIKSFAWIGYILFLCVLEFSPFYSAYMAEVTAISRNSQTLGSIWTEEMGLLNMIARHPIILILLTPFFYRSPQRSDYVFFLSFDGIDTVKKVLPLESKEIVSRVFIKWKEIERVEKGKIGEKEILRLYSLEGPTGDIIWSIDVTKKKAIHLLLKGMIVPKHPMRIFLENEKELK